MARRQTPSRAQRISSRINQRMFRILVSPDDYFHRYVGVDDITDLPDCPLKFEYGKPFLPQFMFEGLPVYMTRMHNWYIRGHVDLASEAFGLGMTSIFSEQKLTASKISCSIFKTSKTCSATTRHRNG